MQRKFSRSWEKRGKRDESVTDYTYAAKIEHMLSDGRPHTAAELARRLGVSSRTLRRWLHFFRDELGMPIETHTKGFVLKKDSNASPAES